MFYNISTAYQGTSVLAMKKGDDHDKRNYTRGIYMADLPLKTRSSVQGGFCPVLVIQNDRWHCHAATVQVIPLTSRCKANLPVHIKIKGYGLKTESTLLTEQIQTIDKSLLRQCIRLLDNDMMDKVNSCVMLQLGMFDDRRI